MNDKPVFVTEPFLPPLDEFIPYLEEIWKSGVLSNGGPFHKELEARLCEYLGVPYVSLCSNGTVALMLALKALKLKGEVITTPYSFVATSHAIKWNGLEPVFVDVDEHSCNLDVTKIESAITENTTAILPVHVYGVPCFTEQIQEVADRHNLKVIYDAAHAFGVKQGGESVLSKGDLSIVSFHATKVFNTFEGGAIISQTKEMKDRIDSLKNFAFQDNFISREWGLNGKMNEIQASMGLLQLKYVDQTIEYRKGISEIYRNGLNDIAGIRLLDELTDVSSNYSYFPIFVSGEKYGLSRDELCQKFEGMNIFPRKYFFPLISDMPCYENSSEGKAVEFPTSVTVSSEVLCLPLHSNLSLESAQRIVDVIRGE